MATFGTLELLLLLIIVVLLFGAGRIARIGSEMGSAITNFRKGVTSGKESTPDGETS